MTYSNRRVTVVVPAHDEALFIGDVVRTMPAYVDRIIVVDDASTDDTAQAASRLEDPRVEILTLRTNAGVGGAMVAGYRRALEVESEIIVKMDGDGQMPPEHLSSLLDVIVRDGYAYAKGNRFLLGSPRKHMPRHRFVGNMVLTFLTKMASGYWHIFDPQNGYTAITADALHQIDLDALHRGYFFENDMLIQLNLHQFRARDVPMPVHYGHEISGISPLRVGIAFPLLLFKRFIYRIYQKYMLRDFSPIALFLLVGAALFLWGLGFGTLLWINAWMQGVTTSTGTIMLAIVPLFLGFQLLLEAIVLDIQETPR
jgi:glycosyltransferase involved in cell wall biosynthesis